METRFPEPTQVLGGISDVRATLAGETRSIDTWRAQYREDLTAARQKPDIAIFNSFVNCLLERAMPGEAWTRRMEVFEEAFASLADVTPERIAEVLQRVGYRFPAGGLTVVLAAKRIVTSDGFSWWSYVQRAEESYENDFREDPFLGIKGVAFKTRDLALSELSGRFVAIDLHIVRVTTRTGLLLHGYGHPEITTDVGRPKGYLFFHDLMLKLARRTGWPEEDGYSPGEIDRMLWHFGRSVCKATPLCTKCPLQDLCLTACGQQTADHE